MQSGADVFLCKAGARPTPCKLQACSLASYLQGRLGLSLAWGNAWPGHCKGGRDLAVNWPEPRHGGLHCGTARLGYGPAVGKLGPAM
jgi:hypothetical protein